jgi:glucose dehydrogenase
MRLRPILGFICCFAMIVTARVAHAGANAEWPIYGGDYANTHYSSLKQINSGNVAHLRPAYIFQLGALGSNESTPIVVGDTLYVTTSWGPSRLLRKGFD